MLSQVTSIHSSKVNMRNSYSASKSSSSTRGIHQDLGRPQPATLSEFETEELSSVERKAIVSLLSTSSTHAEFRATLTLVKDLLFIICLCFDRLDLPAIISEDNSTVVTITNDETAYAKKCKHFMMLINYVREQVDSA